MNHFHSNHVPRSGTFEIKPGVTTFLPLAMEVNLIDVQWSITETTIEDKYEITVEQTFATNVPTPVLITEPASINVPEMAPGEVFVGEFTVTNYGLIAVYEVGLDFPTAYGEYDIEVMTDAVPDRIEAMQTVIVPYRITRRTSIALGGDAGGGVFASETKQSLYACNGAPSPLAADGIGDSVARYADLFEETSGYGGQCISQVYITVFGKCIICPGTVFATELTRVVNTILSFFSFCDDGEGVPVVAPTTS